MDHERKANTMVIAGAICGIIALVLVLALLL